jgi:hypothetical protein
MGGKRLTGQEIFVAMADTGFPGQLCRYSESNE